MKNFQNEKNRQSARILLRLLGASGVLYLVAVAIGLYIHDPKMVAITLAGLSLLTIPLVLLRRQNLNGSSFVFVLFSLATVTGIATVGQGIRDTAVVAFPVIILFAGLTLDSSFFKTCVGVALAAIAWLAAGEVLGWFIPQPFEGVMATWISFIFAGLIFLIAALAVELLALNMRKNLVRTEHELAQRKQAENDLRKSESSFRSLFEKSATGYVLLSPDGLLLKANAAIADMLGYTVDELLNINFRDITHPDDIAASSECIRALLAGEQDTYRFEKRYIHRNGKPVWTFVNTTIVRSSRNAPLYFITNIINITDRRQAIQRQFMFSTLIQNSTDIFIIKDLDFRIITANKAFIQAAGRTSISELIGKTDAEIAGLPEESEPFISYRSDDIRAAALPLGEKRSREEIIPVPNKGDRTFLTQKFPIGNKSDEVIGIGVISTDITELKKNEATREKINSKLNQIQKLESLGALAGGIAHDFNNLMGGIFGYIELARNASTEEKVIQRLSNAMNTIGQAKSLTAQLLTFAKGGAPVREVAHLFPFVKETAKFALSGSNVSCRFDVPPDLWTCNFDRNQIGQVISNMVINAQQAMPAGGTVKVTARNTVIAESGHPVLPAGNYAEILIKDSGSGIRKELLSKIFDPFYTTKTMGHGLGLSTCYSIIKRHDGCIEVESEPGKGSTFHVYLPACKDTVLPASDKPDTIHTGNGTFLIMDDEEVMRETMHDMLVSLGYTVVSTARGEDALDFFKTEHNAGSTLAGMIFDLTVPGGMGGKEAIKEIRKTDTVTPAFVASGYADDPVMKNPADYGFTASICKPFRMSELLEMLNMYLTAKG